MPRADLQEEDPHCIVLLLRRLSEEAPRVDAGDVASHGDVRFSQFDQRRLFLAGTGITTPAGNPLDMISPWRCWFHDTWPPVNVITAEALAHMGSDDPCLIVTEDVIKIICHPDHPVVYKITSHDFQKDLFHLEFPD